MSEFREAMTGLYAALPGLPKADVRYYLTMAAQLEAFHAHVVELAADRRTAAGEAR